MSALGLRWCFQAETRNERFNEVELLKSMAELNNSCVVSLVRCSQRFIDFVRSTIVICNRRRSLHILMEMC